MDRDTLLACLTGQRRHILGAIDGLDDEALRRPVLPSGWSCLGLLQHLALDDERFWFRAVVAGERAVIDALAGDAWTVDPGRTAEEVIAVYRDEIERADAIIAATPLDAAPAWWPDFFPNFRLDNLGEVLLHVITETACHAGHLDAARELIDGEQWMVL
jgi:hypothetical protein